MKKSKKSESNFVKPDLWIDDPVNSAESSLRKMKNLERKLMEEGRLASVTLPDGCILTTTKEKLEEKIKEYSTPISTSRRAI